MGTAEEGLEKWGDQEEWSEHNDLKSSLKSLRSSLLYSAIGDEMPKVKGLITSAPSSANQHKKPLCYAIVGIGSAAERTIFARLMRRFEFDDLMFVSNPEVEEVGRPATTTNMSGCRQDKNSEASDDDDVVILEDSNSAPSTSIQSGPESLSNTPINEENGHNGGGSS
ncbi:unnamed protein product [Strongylus vulgaris]|uniref:Uncharacterized protein n=1 Tax=Strongylus vulgaris TaxID=40348 RepID=A0A3P7I906_STRVU|nr:unnamed protein product [Strongylus vulgaris]